MTRQNGFTLIELLAALLAGSGILVTLSWSVSILSTMLAASRQSGLEERVAGSAVILTSLLSGARPQGPSARGFEGRSDGLRAIVSTPAAAGPVGLVQLDLDVKRTRQGEDLVARLTPLSSGNTFPAAASEPQHLLTNMRSIRFDYGDEVGSTTLPSLITLHVRDQYRHERTIQISPRLTTDGLCRFDPISLTCRR